MLEAPMTRVAPVVAELHRERERASLSRDQLGKRAGYAPHQISRWEHGYNQPSILAVTDLAMALGFTLELREMTAPTDALALDDDPGLVARSLGAWADG